ncbi:MAG TPA: hypothetical protein VGD80_03930, partial [Kofleriaceae bacterium]
AGWEEAAAAEVRARPTGPAAVWLRPRLARQVAVRGDYSEAAALLGITGAAVAGVLAALGAKVSSVSWHEAWHALRVGEVATALGKGVAAIGVHRSQPPRGLLSLLVAAVDAAAMTGIDAPARELLRTLARQSLAWSLDDDAVESWPSRRLGRAGVAALAGASLVRRLARSTDGLADDLHALALVAESACLDAAAAGETAVGQRFLLIAVACWSALSRQDEALHRFAASRLRRYDVVEAPPRPARLASLIEEHVEALVRDLGDPLGLGVDRGSLLAHLETCALDAVRDTGGLIERLRAGRRVATVAAAGPMLMAMLGLQGELEAPLGRLGSEHQVRRLYSSLGPAATLLWLQKFDEVGPQLEGLIDASSALQPDVAGALLATLWPDRGAVREEARNLLVEAWLGVIRTAVAQCPIAMDGLRGRLSEGLIACGRVDRTTRISDGIAEIAVGRSSALLQGPSDSDRRAGGMDRRSSEVRRAEALDLLRLTWTLTRHKTVQGPLPAVLNSEAVRAGNQDEYDRALSLLLEAMEVNPSARQAADNLVTVVNNRCLRSFAVAPDLAETWVLRARASLEELLERHPGKAGSEIRRCLDIIGSKTSTPFFNASGNAQRRGDWTAAAALMLQASRVGPDDADTHRGVEMLVFTLLMKADAATAPLVASLMSRRKELAQRPSAETEAERLVVEALEAAHRGKHEHAVRLFLKVRELAPQQAAVQRNLELVTQEWAMQSLVEGDAAGFARALKTLELVQQS